MLDPTKVVSQFVGWTKGFTPLEKMFALLLVMWTSTSAYEKIWGEPAKEVARGTVAKEAHETFHGDLDGIRTDNKGYHSEFLSNQKEGNDLLRETNSRLLDTFLHTAGHDKKEEAKSAEHEDGPGIE
jgi:hypothetical protein